MRLLNVVAFACGVVALALEPAHRGSANVEAAGSAGSYYDLDNAPVPDAEISKRDEEHGLAKRADLNGYHIPNPATPNEIQNKIATATILGIGVVFSFVKKITIDARNRVTKDWSPSAMTIFNPFPYAVRVTAYAVGRSMEICSKILPPGSTMTGVDIPSGAGAVNWHVQQLKDEL
ncbi:hypothetical protein E4U42_005988 [Claviceps africana]|uniref:Uncharacterized protein n=1 Tax=Claviceps africana TaxID=83212 RepID=A0A8K0JC32_9HYPO|nr:hypothetical protein E4U42_005988 [Claviceps africana]